MSSIGDDEIDRQLIADADNDDAWEPPVSVHPNVLKKQVLRATRKLTNTAAPGVCTNCTHLGSDHVIYTETAQNLGVLTMAGCRKCKCSVTIPSDDSPDVHPFE